MNVTVLTTRLFDTPGSGGEICTARLMAALHAAGHQVRWIGRGAPSPASPWAAASVSLGPLVPPFDLLPRHQRVGSLALTLASGQASTVHRLSAGDSARRARDALLAPGAPPIDALVVDHLQAWAWIDAVRDRLPAPLLLMHNLESAGYAEQALAARGLRRWFMRREAVRLMPFEARALRHAACVACLSETDAQWVRQAVEAVPGRPPVEVLPGYPLARPDEVIPSAMRPARTARPRSANDGTLRIGLLGSWTWGPNRAGLRWMLDAVLPRLPAHARLLLAGSGLEQEVLPERVQSLGRIDDVASFYDTVDRVALPARTGSGVLEKAIEAIVSARPVVATRHALRGLGPDLPGHVQVADAAEDFAALCSRGSPAVAPDSGAIEAWAARREADYRAALARGLLASARSLRPAWPAPTIPPGTAAARP